MFVNGSVPVGGRVGVLERLDDGDTEVVFVVFVAPATTTTTSVDTTSISSDSSIVFGRLELVLLGKHLLQHLPFLLFVLDGLRLFLLLMYDLLIAKYILVCDYKY